MEYIDIPGCSPNRSLFTAGSVNVHQNYLMLISRSQYIYFVQQTHISIERRNNIPLSFAEDSFKIASSATSTLKSDATIFSCNLDSDIESPMTFLIDSIQDTNFALSSSERLLLSSLGEAETSMSSLSSTISGSVMNEAIFCCLLRSNRNCCAIYHIHN